MGKKWKRKFLFNILPERARIEKEKQEVKKRSEELDLQVEKLNEQRRKEKETGEKTPEPLWKPSMLKGELVDYAKSVGLEFEESITKANLVKMLKEFDNQ